MQIPFDSSDPSSTKSSELFRPNNALGKVIDAGVDEDALLDRIWDNDFVKSRVEKYQAIFCHLQRPLQRRA
jgi:hypothetical protein